MVEMDGAGGGLLEMLIIMNGRVGLRSKGDHGFSGLIIFERDCLGGNPPQKKTHGFSRLK